MKLFIRKYARYLYFKISFLIFYISFLKYTFRKKKIVVFDIDNTIANTWPSLLCKYKSEEDRLISLPVFDKVVEVVKSHIATGEKIIFLTARDYRQYFVTLKWLKNIGFSNVNLVMVSKPLEKIFLLSKIPQKNILLYDDMSYNHEKGCVQFYEKEIYLISQMKNIKHFDYNYLTKLND
jgi:hypothetical protein